MALRPLKAAFACDLVVDEVTLVMRVVLEDCDALATPPIQLPIPFILCYHSISIRVPIVYLESIPMPYHLIALFFLLGADIRRIQVL